MKVAEDKRLKKRLPTDADDLNGVQKAAILLISLGVEKAAKILKELKEPEVEQLTIAIADMQDIDSELVDDVRREYYGYIQSKASVVEGGTDYAHNLLSKSLGEKKADEVMEKHQYEEGVDAFSLFQLAEIEEAVQFLKNESPQVAAVILAHLKIEKAAEILSELPDDLQTSVAYRMANMKQISSDVLVELKGIIKDEIGTDYEELKDVLKGVSAVADILNESNVSTERNVLQYISEQDEELADDIKQQMFLFEDIQEMEDRTLQEIIPKLDKQDMVMGLKGVEELLKQKFLNNISERAGEILVDDLENLGPVHVNQVEEAQRNILRVIQELDEKGEITLRKTSSENIIE